MAEQHIQTSEETAAKTTCLTPCGGAVRLSIAPSPGVGNASPTPSRVINDQGPEAVFLPENSHLIRAVAKHSPPELLDESHEWLRQMNYFEASTAMKRIAAEQGPEALARPEHTNLLFKMMLNAPPALMDAFEADADAMGLLPPTTHVDANGQPVYSLEQIADQLGTTAQELEELLPRMPDEEGLLHTGPVFPLQ